MSAIYGILDTRGKPVDPQALEGMRSDLAHRGPDGQWLWQEVNIALGHMLLCVTPESKYETGPCLVEHLVVSADARLDERELLMDKLGVPAARRGEITDPELIGRAYLKWEEKALAQLCGDFAFAIWDRRARRLFCARDHVGVKPFVYAWKNGVFAWATEMRAVVRLPWVGKELSREYQIEYISGAFPDAKLTIWQDVHRLGPACSLYVENKDFRISRYWTSTQVSNIRFSQKEDYVEAYRSLLIKAVEDRLRTDYEVGSLLSGGLDSSAVSCIAADALKVRNRQLFANSAVLPETHIGPERDERDYIEVVANSRSNINTMYTDESGLSYSDQLFAAINIHYQPVNPFFYLDQALSKGLAAKPGLRRVVSGYFGDAVASNWSLNPLPCLLGTGRLHTFITFLKQRRAHTRKSVMSLVKNEVLIPVMPMGILDLYRKVRKQPPIIDLSTVAANWKPGEQKAIRQKLYNSWYGLNLLNYPKSLWPDNEDYFYEEYDTVFAQDRLEAVYPLADVRILEYLLGIPPEILQYQGVSRGLFRKAIEGIVPQKITSRKNKYAFSPRHAQILYRGYGDLIPRSSILQQDYFPNDLFDYSKQKSLIQHLEISKETSNFAKELINVHNSLIVFFFREWLTSQNFKSV